jgi:hypothetical protein
MATNEKRIPLTKKQAGQLGGRATFARYGRTYMQAIGRKGAATFWQRYTLYPMRQNDFAIVRRDTGEFVASLNGYKP